MGCGRGRLCEQRVRITKVLVGSKPAYLLGRIGRMGATQDRLDPGDITEEGKCIVFFK